MHAPACTCGHFHARACTFMHAGTCVHLGFITTKCPLHTHIYIYSSPYTEHLAETTHAPTRQIVPNCREHRKAHKCGAPHASKKPTAAQHIQANQPDNIRVKHIHTSNTSTAHTHTTIPNKMPTQQTTEHVLMSNTSRQNSITMNCKHTTMICTRT